MFEVGVPQVVGAIFTAGKGLFDLYQKDQAVLAADVLAKQMAKGRVWAITDDKAAAALWTYLRAAREGAARRNLEMMAEALVNGASEPTFAVNEFKRHADTLASLSRDEVLIVAEFIKVLQFERSTAAKNDTPLWQRVRDALASTPAFRDVKEVEAHTAALVRTGWIIPVSAYGGLNYEPTSLLRAVELLVDFPAAAARETGEP